MSNGLKESICGDGTGTGTGTGIGNLDAVEYIKRHDYQGQNLI